MPLPYGATLAGGASPAALDRAEASVTKAHHRAYAAMEQPLLHLPPTL